MSSPLTAAPTARRQAAFHKVAECLYRHESSGIYYALVKRSGKQFRRSLQTTDRQLAARRLTEFREKTRRLEPAKEGSRMTLGELADRWINLVRGHLKPSSARRRLTSINMLKPHFGEMSVRSITARDCDDWVMKRGTEVAASTFNNERETLQQILDYAKRDGLILDSPAANVARRRTGKPNIVIPSKDQFRMLIETIRSADCRAWAGADLVELLAYSGMRLSEATALCWGDVDFARESFTVTGGAKGTKNHEPRMVPLFPALRRLLDRLRSGADRPSSQHVIPISDAKKAIGTACQKAGLPHYSHHTMRHYFVSNAIEAGVDFKTIAGWVGHRDGGVLVAKTYGHLRDSHSAEMARRMTFDVQSLPAS